MVTDQNTEIEVKLTTNVARLDKMRTTALLAGKNSSRVTTTTRYFDTADWRLHTAGLQLRTRYRRGAKSAIQTVKSELQIGDATVSRGEWSCVAKPLHPDIAAFPDIVGTHLQQALGDAQLLCFAHSDIDRETRQITYNHTQIEVAFDTVKLTAGKHHSAFHELECELKSGTLTGLFDFILTLPLGPELSWSTNSKGERARLLATSEQRGVAKLPLLHLDPLSTPTAAFCHIEWQCFRNLLHNYMIIIETQDAEAVHQTRVALRRMLSCLALFEKPVMDHENQMLAAGLKAAAQSLSATRSVDVLIAQRQKFSDDSGRLLDANCVLEIHVADRRSSICAEAVDVLTSAHFQRLLIRLALQMEGETRQQDEPLNADSLVDHARHCLHKCHSAVMKYGTNVKTMTAKERHHLRITAKRLRDMCEFFVSLFPRHANHAKQTLYFKALEKIQAHLGDLNDLADAQSAIDLLCADLNNVETVSIKRALEDALREHSFSKPKHFHKANKAIKSLRDIKPFWALKNTAVAKKVST